MMIIQIDNRRSPREIWQEIYRAIANAEVPRLGIVAVGRTSVA